MKFIKLILLFILCNTLTTAQSEILLERQYLSFSMAGGVSIAFTDYVNRQVGPAFRSGIEYYVFPHPDHRIGLGFQFGYQELKGQDDRRFISSNDGHRIMPPSFSTITISPGFFSKYSYLISDRFSVFGRMGLSYNVFNPKDNLGADAAGYNEGLYSQDFFTFIPETGFNYRISDNIELALALNYALPVTDYLDDISAGVNNDSYSNILLEFGYSFTDVSSQKSNTMSDGIKKGFEDITYDKMDEKRFEIVKIDSLNTYKPIREILDEIIQLQTFNELLIPTDEAFYNGTAKFNTDIYSELDRIVDLINAQPNSKWRIEGHIDNQGVKSEIKKLSHERAKAVHDYFVSKGIQTGRLRVYGLADNFPIGDNYSADGRKLNRRIMLIREAPVKLEDSIVNLDTQNINNDKEIKVENEVTQSGETFDQFILRCDDTFENNSADLKELSKFLLNEFVLYFKQQPGSKWKIEGHTDNQGSKEFQNKLSYERAKSVFDYLISQGLSPDQFRIEGMGNSSPIVNDSTEDGRSTNRRVLIIREK